MANDPAISHPTNSAYQRDGCFNDNQLYLVYESTDIAALIEELRTA
jgi:hypothetical protein